MLRIFSILISIFFVTTAWAQDGLVIEAVLNANTVKLSDGQTIMLGGILVKEGAEHYLNENFKGKEVEPIPENAIHNRYGEVIAHLKTRDGQWIQQDLIRNDFAYAYTMASFRDGQRELQKAETNKITVLDANAPIDKSIKGFQIVEGIVVDGVERGKYVYLNFGDDYKTDFTLSVKRDDHKAFLDEGFNVLDFKGKKIRMRG